MTGSIIISISPLIVYLIELPKLKNYFWYESIKKSLLSL